MIQNEKRLRKKNNSFESGEIHHWKSVEMMTRHGKGIL